jgi:hypothetical protein
MGDERRFDLFAKLIAKHIPTSYQIADVASGKGNLQAALRQLGYKKVISWDKQRRNASPRSNYHYDYFNYNNAPRDYDAVVAMHPDEATDHAIMYAAKHKVPAIVCPCCVKPSAVVYWGDNNEHRWIAHLKQLAEKNGLEVTETMLKMSGRNRVLICKPKKIA